MKNFIKFLKTDVKIINSYFLLAVILIILISIGYSSYALFSFTKTSNTIETSRIIIEKNMDKYKNKVKETLEDLNYNTTFTINFGDNYFPKKEYKDVIYEEGNYESLVVTLGNGEGDNWWCVLFPPICTLEVEENKDIEYKFFVKEIFEKYLKR